MNHLFDLLETSVTMLLAKFFGVENFLCILLFLKYPLCNLPPPPLGFLLVTIKALVMFMDLLISISSIKASQGCLLLVKAASCLAYVTLGFAKGSKDSKQAVTGWNREVLITS